MDRPAHVPRRLALIDASPETSDGRVAHLLADLEEALHAYEHYSAYAVPLSEEDRAASDIPKVLPIEHVRWPVTDEESGAAAQCMQPGNTEHMDNDARPGASARADESAPPNSAVLPTCDSVVVGFQTEGDDVAEPVLCRMRRAAEERLFRPDARLYAIAVTDAYDAGCVYPSLDALAELCPSLGMDWSGALAVGGGDVVMSQAGTARMGRKRRARSEGTDIVIAAIRSGLCVAAFSRDGLNVVEAKCPLPRFVYRRASGTLAEHDG